MGEMEHTPTSPGRRRFNAAQRQEFVALYLGSGLTQREFARQHAIKLGTFHQWLHGQKPPTLFRRPTFQELVLPPQKDSAGWSTEILLGGDITVRFGANVSAKFMAQLVKGIRPSC